MNQTFKIGNTEITLEQGTVKLEGIEITVEGLDITQYIQLLKVIPVLIGDIRIATESSMEDLLKPIKSKSTKHDIPDSPFDFFNINSDTEETHALSVVNILKEMFGPLADEKKKDPFNPTAFNPLEFLIKNSDKIGPAKQSIDDLIKAGAPFLKAKKFSGTDLINAAQQAAKAAQAAYKDSKTYQPGQSKDKGNNTDYNI